MGSIAVIRRLREVQQTTLVSELAFEKYRKTLFGLRFTLNKYDFSILNLRIRLDLHKHLKYNKKNEAELSYDRNFNTLLDRDFDSKLIAGLFNSSDFMNEITQSTASVGKK